MRAIILAAGMGERLLPLTRDTPKSLIEIAPGVSVLESQISSLGDAGVNKITLVVGYRAEMIEERVSDHPAQPETIYNPFYYCSNNLVSAWMARARMHKDFMIVNGDNVFNPVVIDNLLADNSDICMVVDRKDDYDADDMKVHLDDDCVTAVSKKLSLEVTNGESVGIMKFQGDGVERMRRTLDSMVRDRASHGIFYLAAMQQIMDSGYPVHYTECSPTDWGEIDFHPDLELIKTNIQRFEAVITRWQDKA